MNVFGWLPFVLSGLLLGAAVATRRLVLRRDWFFLLVYLQSLIYIDIAPTLASASIPFAAADKYAYFQWTALVLFQVPLMAIYFWRVRKNALVHLAPVRLSIVHAALLFGGCGVLAVGYYFVAARHGLLYRRLSDELASVQLNLGIMEFAVYRSFIELGSFLIAVQLFVLRTCAPEERRRWMTTSFAFSAIAFLAYAIVNSRMMSLSFLGILYGIFMVTSRGPLRFRAGIVLGALVTIVGAFYAMRVATNVRQSVSSGEGIFAARNFVPIALDRGKEEDPLAWRLNGLDLIVQITDNVESFGPAWGRAWAVPFVVSLDPIVRTDFTLQAKRVALTTPKSFLLLMYAGVARSDYYNCILTDAYGNFGLIGFTLVALVLAFLLAWGGVLLRDPARPVAVALGLFVLTRALPFEQEFGTLVYGWLKAVPFFVAAALVYPLRQRAGSR